MSPSPSHSRVPKESRPAPLRAPRPSTLGVALLVIVATMALRRHFADPMVGPIILLDEFGYLAGGAFFAGFDWSAVVRGMEYYSFGYGLLIAPFFALLDNRVAVYQGALLLNSLAVAGIFVLAYWVTRRWAPQTRRSTAFLAAVAVSSYPSYWVYANLAWSECVLSFVYWLSFALSALVAREDRAGLLARVGLGLLAGFSYAVHPRAVVLAISSTLTLFVLAWAGRLAWRRCLPFFAGLGTSFGLALAGNHWIQQGLWDGTLKSRKLAGRFSLGMEELLDIGRTLVGHAFYLSAATYLLVLLGFAWALRRVARDVLPVVRRSSRDGEGIDGVTSGALYALLSFLGMFSLSVLFEYVGTRADQVMYGRYVEAVVGPLVLFALLALAGALDDERVRSLRLVVSGAVIFVIIAWIFQRTDGDLLRHGEMVWVNVTGIFPHRAGWRPDVWGTVGPVLVVGLVAWLLSRLRPGVGFAVYSLLFLWTATLVIQVQLTPAARGMGQTMRIPAFLASHADDARIAFYKHGNWTQYLQMYRYQFWLADRQIEPVATWEELRSGAYDYAIVFTDHLPSDPDWDRLVAFEPHGLLSLWALTDDARQTLADRGVKPASRRVFELLQRGEMPPAAYRAEIHRHGPGNELRLSHSSVWDRDALRLSPPLWLRRLLDDPGLVELHVAHRGHAHGWYSEVQVGLQWFAPGETKPVNRQRAKLPVLLPGEEAVVHLRVDPHRRDGTPLPAGRYELRIELVHEGVRWFGGAGGEVIRLPVVVTP